MVRLHAVQHLDQPFVLWIILLLPVILKTVDPALWFHRSIALAVLTMQRKDSTILVSQAGFPPAIRFDTELF